MKRYRVKAMMEVEFTVPAESLEAARAAVAKMENVYGTIVEEQDEQDDDDA